MKSKLILLLGIFLSLTAEEYQFKGRHFVASYYHCDYEALTNLAELEFMMMRSAAEASGATILDDLSYVFEPDGMTMVIMLSESHASIHTYPEHGACFVDLFTCGERCEAERFDACLRAYLNPQSVNEDYLVRQ